MIPASLRLPRAGVSVRVDVRASAGRGVRGRGGACVAGRVCARALPRTWVLGVAERGPRPLRRRLCN